MRGVGCRVRGVRGKGVKVRVMVSEGGEGKGREGSRIEGSLRVAGKGFKILGWGSKGYMECAERREVYGYGEGTW